MFAMPIAAIHERLSAVRTKLGNLPEDLFRTRYEEELEELWAESMGKAEHYLHGPEMTQGRDAESAPGHFNTLSLGAWITLAAEAGIPQIPSRLAGVVNPVAIGQLAEGKDAPEPDMQAFSDLVNFVQEARDDEILRFDPCVQGKLKSHLALGRSAGQSGIPDYRGLISSSIPLPTGGTAKLPDIRDARLLDNLRESPQDECPVWLRQWVAPVMMPGSAASTYAETASDAPGLIAQGVVAGFDPEQNAALARIEAERLAQDDVPHFACEWRVYVEHGKVVAIANHYPQITRGLTVEDREIALAMAGLARGLVERMTEAMRARALIPHHPQYEMRQNPDGTAFDADGMHFTIDFLECHEDRPAALIDGRDGSHGRRLIMIEGGPAHLRAPAWGAHPCSFGTKTAPAGLALGLGRIEPLPPSTDGTR